MRPFETVFKSAEPARDKYLSRLFGLFSERLVRCWCACPESPYEDLGRPTLFESGESRGHTLDFTFRRRSTQQVFVGELKCELEFENYRYLRLADPSQLAHHKAPAFAKLLRLAREPSALRVQVRGNPIPVAGAVLVWGAMSAEGRSLTMDAYGFADVLSVESMLDDLATGGNSEWTGHVGRLRAWSNELFDYLTAPTNRDWDQSGGTPAAGSAAAGIAGKGEERAP